MQSYAFTSQDYVVTDFHIVKELLMRLMHQFYKVSADSFEPSQDNPIWLTPSRARSRVHLMG